MREITNFEFIVGVAVGKILLGALFASPLFRGVALAACAVAVCFLYFNDGVSGILSLAHTLSADFIARPNFSKGAAVGAVVAFIVFGLYRKRTGS